MSRTVHIVCDIFNNVRVGYSKIGANPERFPPFQIRNTWIMDKIPMHNLIGILMVICNHSPRLLWAEYCANYNSDLDQAIWWTIVVEWLNWRGRVQMDMSNNVVIIRWSALPASDDPSSSLKRLSLTSNHGGYNLKGNGHHMNRTICS